MVTVCFEERADFLVRAADGHGGDAEDLAEGVHGGELAQMEHGDQDPVGWGEFGLDSCTGGYQALVTATHAEHVLTLHLQRGSQRVDKGAELLASHARQFRVLQRT